MARRKRSRLLETPKRSLKLGTIFWLLLTSLSGGGVGGYFNPNWPIIGPLVENLTTWRSERRDDLHQLAADKINSSELPDVIKDRIGRATGASEASFRNPPTATAIRPIPSQLASSNRPVDRLLIASFNIQVFGEAKMSKPPVVEILAHIIRQFDIVAIQEIRAKSDEILPRFLDVVNSDGSQYGFLIGPRVGRTISTEQYAFVFDTNRVEYDPSALGTMTDPSDLLHREPFVARFRARTHYPEHAFTFWLVNTHTDPDEVPEEVAALADAFRVMQTARADEDDVILLGDLNANQSQLGPLAEIPSIHWVVRDAMTNTRKTKAYDNLLFTANTTQEYTGRWGVFDFEQALGLTREQALQVSDHLPVWAEFDIWEARSRRAETDAGAYGNAVSIR